MYLHIYLFICSPTHLAQTFFVESSKFYSSIREGCLVIGSFSFYMKIFLFYSGSWKRVLLALNVQWHPSRPSPPASWTLSFNPFTELS